MKSDASECEDEMSAAVKLLLERTRSKISSGDGDQALASLIQAISLTRGEDAVIEVLSEARERAAAELKRNEAAEASAAMVELEAAIAARNSLAEAPSVLVDRCDGSEQILRDAFEDGSSVICTRCGGLVKSARWAAHSSTWCPAIQQDGEDL